ncbi:LOB domain-containing protein 41-like [Lolium rigidum]|uniref:LOB domain-containing protein 41-like n=1 Tax=Lolium rigidum TaxID=89674 RepID=UPI001F5D6214|nr:LOB domain-containing protein 41-like [Lolium rigidum]
MRMSCNGCRVLRKGCSDGCTIRPCLEWIKSPDAQANATVFLAKFYGRAGLLNLLAAGSDTLRPALFRSLLYEACGRMVNPIYGSVGLLWSGQWEACQAAVEAVLKGNRIVQVSSEAVAAAQATPPLGLRAYDIRHVAKDTADPLRVSRAGRTRFKRASSSTAKSKSSGANRHDDCLDHAPTHEESAGSHDHGGHVDDDGMAAVDQALEESEDTEIEAGSHSHSHVSQAERSPLPPVRQVAQNDSQDDDIELELTLGLEPVTRVARSPPARSDFSSFSAGSCHIGLRLELSA